MFSIGVFENSYIRKVARNHQMIMSSMHFKLAINTYVPYLLKLEVKTMKIHHNYKSYFFDDKNDINGYYIFTLDW